MNLNEFVDDIGQWGDRTFDHSSRLCLRPIVKHMLEEVNELLAKPDNGEEMADVMILLCNAAYVAEVDLEYEVHKKMGTNCLRKWGLQDVDGVIHHL